MARKPRTQTAVNRFRDAALDLHAALMKEYYARKPEANENTIEAVREIAKDVYKTYLMTEDVEAVLSELDKDSEGGGD